MVLFLIHLFTFTYYNIQLQRNLSRKGSQRERGGEKKMNSSIENERDPSHVNPTSSPRGNHFYLKKLTEKQMHGAILSL